MSTQQARPKQTKPTSAEKSPKKTSGQQQKPPAIPEHDIKQNAGVSATMALQAAQKAWELRQAANAAGDPNAREEILAKAINKEIEAESFGKAAKYTQSGAFQGLAAGAGLGVQPGVTLGKLTGALVGGTVATVTGLLGGGVGSVYGALNGPFWNLGEMASKGVRGVVGDFPNWSSTPQQKKALEKMVVQTRDTQAPSKEELEQMKRDAPDDMPSNWSQNVKDVTSWRPSMPAMPKMPNMPTGGQAASAVGLGGLGASLFGGGQNKGPSEQQPIKPTAQDQKQRPQSNTRKASNQQVQKPQQPSQPKEAPIPKEAAKRSSTPRDTSKPKPVSTSKTSEKPQKPRATSRPSVTSRPSQASIKSGPVPSVSKQQERPKAVKKPTTSGQAKPSPSNEEKENKPQPPPASTRERRKPRKLAERNNNVESVKGQGNPTKRTPRKLESRNVAA